MKFTPFKLIFFLSSILLLGSCLGTTNAPTAVSSDAAFVSLTLAGNDSVKLVKFTLNADGKTIENIDSLPFKTRIDSVYPTFSFKSTSGARMYFLPGNKFKKDSANVTGKDTIDFRQPVSIINYASDGVTPSLKYTIKVNVHKVQPELYVWKKLNESIESNSPTSQKTIWFNSKLYYYLNNGSAAYLYTSANGTSWSPETSLSGFPINTALGDMLQFGGKLYLSQDGAKIYSSADGLLWTNKIMSDYTFKSLLFDFDSKIWAVVQSISDSKLRFANSTDGDTWIVRGEIPINFPVRDFASISFSTRNGIPKVLVIGGYSSDDISLKNRWSSVDGIKWYDFSIENQSLDSLAVGSSVISYDNKLLLFGGISRDNQIVGEYYRQSIDEGLSWQVPDTINNRLREPIITKVPGTDKDTVASYIKFQPRNYQSVVLDNSDRIYIVGGKTNTNVLSDVWTGKLNRKSFIKQ